MNILNASYFIQFIYFIIISFLVFYIPGNVLLNKIKIESRLVKFTYSYALGIVFWAFQGFLFGFINLRNLTYIYILLFIIFWLIQNYNKFKNLSFKINLQKKDISIILIFIIGVLIQVSITFYNGVLSIKGLNFCCLTPDNLYHIGLTNSLVNKMPPFEPAMYGVVVKNYHYLANLIAADLIRVFRLDLILTQYHYMSLLISVLLGLSAISFGKLLKLGNLYIFFLLLFIFFIGDLTFILTYLNGKGFNFSYPFLYDATTLWFSPPRVYAFMIMLSGIGMFCIWLKNKSYYFSFLLALVFSSLIGIKIYNGIVIFAGLLFVTLFFLIKKQYFKVSLFLISLVIGLIIYLPVATNGASGLAYVGFWRVENFVSQPGFGTVHMELARQIYFQHNNIPRMIQYELMFFLFYFIFVFGTLNLAFFQTRKTLNYFPKELNIFLIFSVLTSFILGFFTFQKIAGSNTSQFLIVFEMIAPLYAALACVYIYRKIGILKFIFLFLIIILTVPRVVNKVIVNYSELKIGRNYVVSNLDLEALNYLKTQTEVNSLIYTDNKNINIDNSCYYITFLSNRNIFLCDSNGILTDHGVNISERLKASELIYNSLGNESILNILRKNKINYLYLSSNITPNLFLNNNLKVVFRNEKITIVKLFK